MFKKIFSTLLSVIMLFSLTASVSYGSIADDVRGSEYETEAKVLGALGVMVGDADTGLFRPSDPIKRAEATKIAVTLSGFSSMASSMSGYSKFPDVAKDYWGNGYINAANANGLVIGDDVGTFRPESQIKFSEAVTILVRALGYETQALSKGGFPTGYIATASSIGLLKGISSPADKLISRGDVSIMAYNALTIRLMEQTGFGTNTKYEITNKTLLKDKLNVELIQGKVGAVGASTIDGGAPLSRGQIRIDGKTYSTGNTDTRTILGFNADAYYSLDSKKIVAIVASDGRNSSLDIMADDIANIKNSLSEKYVEYWQNKDANSKTSKALVDTSATIIYNGVKSDFSKFSNIDSGYFSLLDSNMDGKYDIVFINKTVNYVVDEVYPAVDKLIDMYSQGELTLDFDDDSKTVILEMVYSYIDLSDLEKWDVISFTISEDMSVIYGNVVRAALAGKVTELGDDQIYLGDKKYDIASNYPGSFSIGDEGTFYLDAEGKLAAFDGEKNKSEGYAYLSGLAVVGGVDKKLSLELFTQDGKLETANAASKIIVNSKSYSDPQKALEAIGGKGQLISLEKNTDGQIKKITTATAAADIDENKFTLNYSLDDAVYTSSTSKLSNGSVSITIDNSTVIFDIPADGDKDDYAVRRKSTLSDKGIFDLKVYNLDESYRASVIVITESKSVTDEGSDIAVVDKLTKVQNSKGETIYKLYAVSGGKSVSLNTKDDKVLAIKNSSLVNEGDIILFRTNDNGEIDAARLLFDASKDNSELKQKLSDNLTTVFGRVDKKFSSSINVKIGEAITENFDISEANIYVYDSALNKNKVSVGDISDIERYENKGGKVFLRIFKDSVKDVVVVK